ncbi:hypothetical protein K8P10_000509 [Leucobacter sp. Psy1]|uniref:DUF485 domain-containing protein n=1 Tax=Leucobacter sp. Psy1 TaxID=2875729 RepID=UPI001CD1E7E5|nr:DUF485 domain-containing protein [Leucobacter sp. Psy1]UBH04998.1 hypothetical protein K8P10_000509 [Leucobacter sp. Psy1]
MPDEHPPGPDNDAAPPIDYISVQESPEFIELKRRFRRFVFPVSVAFFVWFITYVLLAAYAHDFMATPVFGNVNLGIILGLGQFVTTFAITMIYVRFANKRLDPLSVDIRADLEERAGNAAQGGDR